MKRFNALDIFICVTIFAAVTAAVMYLGGGVNPSVMASDQKTVSFTVEVVNMPVGFSEKMKLGDIIQDSTKGYHYGEISEIRVEPARLTTINADEGVVVRTEMPERETIYITVRCNGTESDVEIMAEGQVIKIGKRMTLKGKGYAVSGFISEITTEAK